ALGPDDGKRNDDAPRPGGHLVDVEIKPIGEKHELRHNGRDARPVIEAEERQVKFAVGVDLVDPAQPEDAFPGAYETTFTGVHAGELHGPIGLKGGGNLARAVPVDRPSAVRVLTAQNITGQSLNPVPDHRTVLPPKEDVEHN